MVRRHYLHVATRTISYFDSDPTAHSARVTLLIHAFPLGAAMWDGQAKAMPSGWRLLAPDLRGFGGSSLPEPDDTPAIDDYASDVIDLMRELGIESAVIGGCSMGGYVTMAVLRRAPEMAEAIVLANTRSTADSLEARANRRSMLAIVDREGPSGVARDMIPKLLGKTTLAERADIEPLVRRLTKQQSPAAIRGAILRMMERPDSTAVVSHLTVPLLIVAGEEDALIPLDDSKKMHAANAKAELVVVPRAGHLVSLEDPAAFNDSLQRFLGRL